MNLERANVMLVDDGVGLDILSQVFYGFGARTLHKCRSLTEAIDVATVHPIDLIVTEALVGGEDGYAFVRAIRAGKAGDANRFVPVMVLSAHTATSRVASSRDCGANFFVAKPITPQVIMDRLLWVAREKRQYLEADSYIGPDRRFQTDDLPEGVAGRRRGDYPPMHGAESVNL